MRIAAARVTDFRSIADSGELELGQITLFVGENNSGKSAFLRALYLLQQQAVTGERDRRLRSRAAPSVRAVFFDESPPQLNLSINPQYVQGRRIEVDLRYNGWNPDGLDIRVQDVQSATSGLISGHRPDHLFVPIFARRKVNGYETNVDRTRGTLVTGSDAGLTSHLSMLLAGQHSEGIRYREYAERLFNMLVSVSVESEGQRPGYVISSDEAIPLDQMGEGVSGTIRLLAELASDTPRVFLIEEPENDLHPRALREVIELIREASETSQFIITTHSDIVLRHLGSVPEAKVYETKFDVDEANIPRTHYAPGRRWTRPSPCAGGSWL